MSLSSAIIRNKRIAVSHLNYTQSYQVDALRVINPHLFYVVKGKIEKKVNNQNITMEQSEIWLIPKGFTCTHIRFADNTQVIDIEILEELYIELETYCNFLDKFQSFNHLLLKATFNKICHLLKIISPTTMLLIESRLNELLVFLNRFCQTATMHYWYIKKAQQKLMEEFDRPYCLPALASEIGMNPSYLARQFKKSTGTTIGEFIRELRVLSACNLLKETDASICKIATTCGFCDQSQFTKIFSQTMGISPYRFKKIKKSL